MANQQSLFILILISLFKAQELWEIIYQSFQDKDTMDVQGWIVSNNFDENLFSTCNGFTLFGGINVFARYTIISKQFSLPPHYGVRVTFEFWKIDSWNYDEIIYAIVDDKVFSKHYLWFEGSQMCGIGNDWNELKEQITFILDHNSESLIFVMTSNLDQDPVDESWGIRNFVLSILRCPQNCLYCLDNDYSNCYFWIGLLQQWHQSINLDGWMKNDNIQPAIQKCVSFDLVQLAPNDRLEKTIENLTPHYKMQINVQAWQIDSWNNETFSLGIDDKLYNQTLFETSGIYSLCGNNGLELIFNIGVSLFHSQSQCQISMSTNHNTKTTNASLGIRAINIYLAKCFTGCAQCIGPQKTDCTVCQSGWVFYNNLCSHPPPMLFSTISINQIQDSLKQERIPMEIHLLEVDQQISTHTYGNQTILVRNNQIILTIQVYVKCFPNKIIKGLFQINKPQNLYQYQYKKNCQQSLDFIIFKVKYELKTISDQNLIINTSNTKCLIYQVINVADNLNPIKVLEIFLEDM